ncbi:MAG TPA: Gfo/Idh/MocA family oxidoreductase, partial [Cellulomonas sp.]|nr:Gfo/Idh/MocA family oxidoreductase [Cellulomonas sp.]
ADGRLTVFQNRRWDPEQLALRAVLAAGELGHVHRFERRWERYRPEPQHRWKENDVEAGGLLLDLGAHLVDSAVQLFGPARSVYAELRALTTPAVDDVFLALTHDDGVISHLQAGGLAGAPGPRTRVLGAGGAYLVTSFEGEPTPFAALDDAYEESRRPGEPEHEGWIVRGDERTPVPRPAGGHGDIYPALARWVAGTGPLPVDPADAVATARVLDAARVAADEGRVVTLS